MIDTKYLINEASYSSYHCTIFFPSLQEIFRHIFAQILRQIFLYSEKTLVRNPSARRRCAICIFCQSKRELGCFSGKSDWNQHHQLTFGQVWPEKLMAGAFPHLLTTALLIYNAHRWACKDKYKHKNIYKNQRQVQEKKYVFGKGISLPGHCMPSNALLLSSLQSTLDRSAQAIWNKAPTSLVRRRKNIAGIIWSRLWNLGQNKERFSTSVNVKVFR